MLTLQPQRLQYISGATVLLAHYNTALMRSYTLKEQLRLSFLKILRLFQVLSCLQRCNQ